MTVRLLEDNGMPAEGSIGVSFLPEMAVEIRDEAEAFARAELMPAQRQAHLAELLELPGFRHSFGKALAMGVAQALAANDQRVRAVYAYEAAPGPGVSAARQALALAHLIVHVTESSAALEVFVASLNQALSVRLSGIIGARFGQCQPPLDINVVTEQQIQQGAGLARLLSAVRPRPIKLWQRQAKTDFASGEALSRLT